MGPDKSYYFISTQLNISLLAVIETFEKPIQKDVRGSPFEPEKLPWKTPMAGIIQIFCKDIKPSMIISGSWWQVRARNCYQYLYFRDTKTVSIRAKVHPRSYDPSENRYPLIYIPFQNSLVRQITQIMQMQTRYNHRIDSYYASQ